MHRPSLRLLLFAILMTALTAIQGCRSSKSFVSASLSDDTEAELYDRLISDYKPWDDIYMPVTLSMSSPEGMSVSGRATFIRDSVIHLSLRMLGMEIAVVYVNNEHIYIIDKFNKRYIEESLSRLPDDLPVNVANLQDMLLGRAFLPGADSLTQADISKFFLAGSKGQTWTLTPLSQSKGAGWHFSASRTNPPMLTGISLRLADGKPAECVYADPRDTAAGLLASMLVLSATAGSKEVKVNISWGLEDARWDTGRTVKFSPPGSSYKRISLDSLIKSFKVN